MPMKIASGSSGWRLFELSRRTSPDSTESEKGARGDKQELVITPANPSDEELQMDIACATMADTKVEPGFLARSANFLQRDENVTNVFPGSALVKDLAEAKSK